MSGERLGIFGGAFDPVHVGHLFVADAVRAQANLDRVLFLPVGDPAHRKAAASAEDRTAMVRAAISDNPSFALDATALRQSGPVYTADTMPLLRAAYPDAELSFIAGADSLVDTPWRRLDEVVEFLAHFFVAGREGADAGRLRATLASLPADLAARFVFLNLPLVDVSASAIRERVAEGKPIRYLVPGDVERYIREKKLYRHTQGGRASSTAT
jgi:nicotinate-nucleotide adenylyltransferase